MGNLVWIGALLTLAGLVGLGWCIAKALAARKAGLTGEEMTERLRHLVPVNMASLFLSVAGLMAVILGLLLG